MSPTQELGLRQTLIWPTLWVSIEERKLDELYPILFKQILELVQQASQYQQLKKGANEGIYTSLLTKCMFKIDI